MRVFAVSSAGYASYRLERGRAYVVGRAAGCDIQLDDPSISRRHAQLEVDAQGQVTLTDLGSGNGCIVHGGRLEPGQGRALRDGDTATIGAASIMVQRDRADALAITGAQEFVRRLETRCRERRDEQLRFVVVHLVLRGPNLDEAITSAAGHGLRSLDLLGRLGEGEYAVVLDDVPRGRAATSIDQLSERLRRQGLSVEVGQATWPDDAHEAAALVAHARRGASPNQMSVVIGRSMEPIIAMVDRVAASDLAVMLVGETGVGKEVLAARVHARSLRARGPFVKLNCAALPEQLLESELFGHVRGAFTGADREHPGLLVAAHNGTLFLDEIGEMPLQLQAKLLRAVEDRQVRPVGATRAIDIDVRFISATNRASADDTCLRRDLYYRLSGMRIDVPPLRQRVEEIVPLSRLFLQQFAARHDRQVLRLSSGSVNVLTTYTWPGNVRELRNIIERVAVMAGGETIEPSDFPIAEMTAGAARSGHRPRHAEEPTLVGGVTAIDRDAVLAALAAHDGNQRLAADALKVSRRTLIRWMELLKIPGPRTPRGPS